MFTRVVDLTTKSGKSKDRNSAETLAYTDNARSLNLNGPDKFREWDRSMG